MKLGAESAPKRVDPSEFLVKVCGITRLEDALLAVESGANALGFNFYPRSKRYLEPEAASAIIAQLPSEVLNFGIVLLGEPYPAIPSEWSAFLQGVQVHRVAGPKEVPRFSGRVLIAVDPAGIARFPGREVIVDTSWGSGELADWEALRKVSRPFVLSGGLNGDNVGEAIRQLRPAGVDVCSGVEASPGRKDPAALRRFLTETFRALKSVALAADSGKG